MNIYVGNLSYRLEEEDLKAAFEQYGEVNSIRIIMDRETGRSKGFGFVEMADEAAGNAAVEALEGTELEGRNLRVSVANEKERRPSNNNRGNSY